MYTLRRAFDNIDNSTYWIVTDESTWRQMHFPAYVFGLARAKELGMEACRQLKAGVDWETVRHEVTNK